MDKFTNMSRWELEAEAKRIMKNLGITGYDPETWEIMRLENFVRSHS